MNVIGIDPAPSKRTVTFDGDSFIALEPVEVRPWVEMRLEAEPRTLIAWDAPLAFDPGHSFYRREVDQRLADAVRDEPAVNTAPFGNLSHWSITCHVLGYPFGQPPCGLQLIDTMPEAAVRPLLIEVHPAFALYQWWRRAGRTDPVPGYKKGGRVQKLDTVDKLVDGVGRELRELPRLRQALELRVAAPDDLLDAMVAWEVGARFVDKTTATEGDVEAGFIVLPEPVE